METRFFGPSGVVNLQAISPKEPIKEGDMILIKLDDLVIEKLLSTDITRKREGTLVIKIGSQVTTLSWAAKEGKRIYNAHKFQDQLLFWGEAGQILNMDFQLIEVDRDLRGKFFKFIANSAKVIPGVGDVISASFSLLQSAINAIQKVDDDSELEFFGSMGNAGTSNGLINGWHVDLNSGNFEVRRKIPNETEPQIRIPFSIFKFEVPARTPKREVVVLLEQVIIKTDQDKELRTLVIETAIGNGRKTKKNNFKIKMQHEGSTPEYFLGIQYRTLYDNVWENGLPFHFSMAFLEKEELDAIEDIIDYTGEVAKERYTTNNKQRSEFNEVTKAVQSLRSVIMEFFPDKISIGTIHGILLENDLINGSPLAQEVPSEMLKVVDLRKDTWSTVEINLRSEKGGEAAIRLKIKELGEEEELLA